MPSPKTTASKAPRAAAPTINPNLQYFNLKKYSREPLEEIGTLRSNFGKDALVEYVPKNWLSDENIYFVVTTPEGESATISCSMSVSELLRSNQMTISQASNLPVILRTLREGKNAGQKRPMIVLPSDESNGKRGGKIADMDDDVFDPSAISKAFAAPAW
jgi:hypothetical protein